MQMGFGKHRSREVRWVVENDPPYLDWVFKHAAGPQAARAEAQQILTEIPDCPQCGRRLTPVLWGLLAELPPRPVVFGGCVVPTNPAAWKCGHCERGFRRDLSRGSLGAAAPLPPLPKFSRVRAIRRLISTVRRLFAA